MGMAEDDNAPATKKDLAEVESALKGDLARVESEVSELKGDVAQLATSLRKDMAEMEDRLFERIRDSQIEILKAFLPWQESVHTQFRMLEANTGIT